MAQYLASHDPESVTEAIDRVVATLDQPVDDFPTEVARRTLADVEW